MYLNIDNEENRDTLLNTKSVNYENNNTEEVAFLFLIKDLDYEAINILCERVAERMGIIEPHYIYSLINDIYQYPEFNHILLQQAYKLVHEGKYLGTKMNGNFNASSWVNHCLIEGELMKEFARVVDLDPHTAMKIGILHDIGRKKTHSVLHTVKGFEYLLEKGFVDEAFCALSHSFLASSKNGVYYGNRCATGDSPIDGFYINEKGEGVFKEGAITDDVKCFLDNYEYNSYDLILNLADLMATSKGVISPYDRVLNIYSKRIPDARNSSFFKIGIVNAFNRFLSIMKGEIDFKPINVLEVNSQEEIDQLLLKTSDTFMDYYLNNIRMDHSYKKQK